MKIADSSSDLETEIVKMTCKLKWIKVRENDWELLSNLNVVKQKFKELRKIIQKKKKLKKLNKVIKFIKENNDAKAKLIEKLKKEAHRAIKKVIMIKGTDEENELNDDDDLKDSASTSKSLKNKLRFTKFVVSIQSSLHI